MECKVFTLFTKTFFLRPETCHFPIFTPIKNPQSDGLRVFYLERAAQLPGDDLL